MPIRASRMLSDTFDTREIALVLLLSLAKPRLWPHAVCLAGRWCRIQHRITLSCSRLGMTRAEIRSLWRDQ